MLTLTRRVNQSIVIETSDGPIQITISSVKGRQVKMNFEAPDNVDIWREELLEESSS